MQAALHTLQDGETQPGEEGQKAAAAALQDVDAFAQLGNSSSAGLVETERDRLIRLVRPPTTLALLLSSSHPGIKTGSLITGDGLCVARDKLSAKDTACSSQANRGI